MDYSKEEIDEAVSGNDKPLKLMHRLEKWDLTLRRIQEDLVWLHEEFDRIYKAIKYIHNESLD